MSDATITIVGCGLIGGSIALALKRRNAGTDILGIDRADRLTLLENSDVWNQVGTFDSSAAGFIQKSSLVVLATPVKVILEHLRQLARWVNPDTVITDVGSTKSRILAEALSALPPNVHFVGGHPMAGSERLGFESADPLLFKNRPYILCPQPDTSEKALLCMLRLIDELRATPVMLEAKEHDQIMAFLSHIPQLLAVILMQVALKADASHQLLHLVAGRGFLDMTRLACSDYSVWESILETNNDAIETALDQLEVGISHTRHAMRAGNLATIWKNVCRQRRNLDPADAGRKRKQDLRQLIDQHDLGILKALHDRFQVVREIGNQKKHAGAEVMDSDRERTLMQDRKHWAQALDLPTDLVDELFQVIVKHSKQLQQSLHSATKRIS